MSKIIFIIPFLLQINILFILAEEKFYILSETGEKGASLTSFTNNLFIISSSKIYNLINKNYNIIQDNKNDVQTQNYFNKNFEIVESSINKNTNESIILIAESSGTGNKINLYSFNISASLEENKNPKLIYSIDSAVDNSKISLIKSGNDKYLLSYFLTENKFENLFFKYSSYGGFEILKKFENNGNGYNYYISCFLLYEQFPVCYYSEKRDSSNNIKCFQNIIVLDVIFNNNYNRFSKIEFNSDYTNCFFIKAVYLSEDYAVFCYIVDNNIVYCSIIKLEINFVNFDISFINSANTQICGNGLCSSNLNKIDLIKVDDNKFLFGCTSNENKPIIKIITVNYDDFSSLVIQDYNINKNVKSTLTLFTHHLSNNNNYYGIIFNDLEDNKLKYAYLNLHKCTPKSNKEILKIKFEEDNNFKLSDYLDFSIENPITTTSSSSSNIQYIIISLISIDNDTNIFNYKLSKGVDQQKIIGDIIEENDDIKIEPSIEQVFNSGKFYIEIAPLIDQIQAKSCKFEFDTICFEGCRTCKKYDNTATEIAKHNCLSCKSNYYSLNDLCLTDCSLIQGYHNIYQTKECFYEELEFINDCNYTIWYIDQNEENHFCSNSNFCPISIPYVYNNTGECIESCRYSELIEADCYISNILGGAGDSLENINSEIFLLGNDIFEKNDENKINKSIVIYGNNITIELSDTKKINNDINKNNLISDFNISDCEEILRGNNNIPDDEELIIVKIDLRRNDTIASEIEYEIFNPITKKILDLSSCGNVIIQSPIYVNNSYSNKIREIYNEGYDIFEIDNKFYSDICIPFYDKKFKADLTLEKKQKVYFYENANLCEKNCKYIGFDIDQLKAICECPIKKDINLDISKEDIFDYIEDSQQKIYHKESISNLKSVKCIKYIFSKKGFKYNWGSYFLILMIIGFVIFATLWFIKGEDLILKYIREILDLILINYDLKHKEKVRQKFEEMRTIRTNNINENNNNKESKDNNKENEDNEDNNENNGNNLENDDTSNGDENDDKNDIVENNIDKDIITDGNNILNKEKEIFRKKGPKKNALLVRSIGLNKENKINHENILIPEKKEVSYNEALADIEIDLLSYDKAYILDKRGYFGYYWSMLKYRQLILFTFFSYDDYNFIFIKIISFFLLLSLNLAYNAIFFFDNIINEIYDNEGKYSIKLEILYIFISSIAFSFTIILVRFIITCHRKYIKLKEFQNYEEAKKESYSIHKKLIRRYIIFIVVGSILILFIWYFITSFCAILHYTQNHCFLNAFLSFLFSMIYPFIYCHIPALFRYFGLNKNKECCYCFSQYI